jgi:hypothetical protein
LISGLAVIRGLSQTTNEPLYDGHTAGYWVDQALKTDKWVNPKPYDMVRKIGAPALPYIQQWGLDDICHEVSDLDYWGKQLFMEEHPLLGKLIVHLGLMDPDYSCIEAHYRAMVMLRDLGTNAQAAILDVADCIETCPALHTMNRQAMLELLPKISGTNQAAMPYLTEKAERMDDFSVNAAMVAYEIAGDTNLLFRTCEVMLKKKPSRVLWMDEAIWFSEHPELNFGLVPLLEKAYPAPELNEEDRGWLLGMLKDCGTEGTNAIARLTAKQTNILQPASVNQTNTISPAK